MFTENVLNTEDGSVCQPKTTSSSTIVTSRNQQSFTQQIIRSRKVLYNSNDIKNDTSSNFDTQIVPMTGDNSICQRTVRTLTKTYRKRIIRRINSNGEVSEEIIEEGEPLCTETISLPQQNISNIDTQLSIDDKSTQNIRKRSTAGLINLENISDSAEEQISEFSNGSFQSQLSNINSNIRNISDTKNSLHEILPDGSKITTKLLSAQKTTVTHSSTINGETKTSSKSEFMFYTGDNIFQATSTMNDMELLFDEMTAKLNIGAFDVFNRFMLSAGNISDHLALAGGDSGSSLYYNELFDSTGSKLPILQKPIKAICDKETNKEYINLAIKSNETNENVEELQQEEIRQKIIAIKELKASNRLCWSHMDEVKSSGILHKMKKEEIHLREGIFEIITSEASYNISLDILIDLYYKSDSLNPAKSGSVINSVEKHRLFSNILLVKGVSLQFLKDLENRWSQKKPKLLDLADIILKHANSKEFEQQYINYIANQPYQNNEFQILMQREAFKSALQSIQSNPKCYRLSLDSFLSLPMQRLTRLKLLLDVVLKLMNQSKELFCSIPKSVISNHEEAVKKLKELLNKSEDKKYELEQKARLMDLANYLEFGNRCKNVAIGSKQLIMEGEVKAHLPQINPNLLKKFSKKREPTFYLIVLSDLVIIAKRKSPTRLKVLDCMDRKSVEVKATPCNSNQCHKLSRDRNQTSQFSTSSISENATLVGCCATFTMKFSKSGNDLSDNILVLATSSLSFRDKWVAALNM